jgi:hypothetical protein
MLAARDASDGRFAATGNAGVSAGFALLVVAAAELTGIAVAVSPRLSLVAALALALVALVYTRPAIGAYLVVGVTPLVVGIDRGVVIPFFRPSEALALIIGGTLAARGLLALEPGRLPRFRPDRLELSLVGLAVASSIVPIAFMMLRGREVSSDDLVYALVLWKYLGVYGIIRFSVVNERQVLRCLWIAVAAAAVVALLAILQALDLLGVRALLAHYYAPFGYVGALDNPRAGSTVSLPAAAADLIIMNLAIVAGLWSRYRRHGPLLTALSGLFVLGAVASGEISSALGLILGVGAIALVTRSLRSLFYLPFAALVVVLVMRPVIEHRLQGFETTAGIPASWIGRLHNLQNYFWPDLFSGWNFLLGVRPAARVSVPSQATGYVWIESGYTWLLWSGGLPLLIAFLYFVKVAASRTWDTSRQATGSLSVAGIASFTGVVVVTALMVFDPHLTYRGSADLLFALLALTGIYARAIAARHDDQSDHGLASASRGHPRTLDQSDHVLAPASRGHPRTRGESLRTADERPMEE